MPMTAMIPRLIKKPGRPLASVRVPETAAPIKIRARTISHVWRVDGFDSFLLESRINTHVYKRVKPAAVVRCSYMCLDKKSASKIETINPAAVKRIEDHLT